MNWREEYMRDRKALANWVRVDEVFPRRTRPTYTDVRRMRRYIERLGLGLLRQPATLLTTRVESIRTEIRAQFPQPRLRGLRGLIVPAHTTREKVRARRTKSGTVLTYERQTGAIARRFVRIPSHLLATEDVDGVRRILRREWKTAKRERYTAAVLALKDGLDSQWDSLVQASDGLADLEKKVATIVKNQEGYRHSHKWFRGIHFLKENRRRASKRKGGVKRERREERAKARAQKKRRTARSAVK